MNARFGTSAVHWRGTAQDPVAHLCRSVDATVPAPRRAPPRRTVRVLGEIAAPDPPDPALASAQGVVFDLDDTLVPHKQWMLDKLEALWQAEREVLPARSDFIAAALRIVEEGPRSTLFDQLAARFAWPDAVTPRLIDSYRRIAPPACAIHPDVLPALATLRSKGYRLGLLTDNPPASQRQKLEAAALTPLFDAVVFSRDNGGDKPNPAAFAAMADALALPAAALVMVGDNPYRDGLGALAAGYAAAFVLARPGGFFNFDPALAEIVPGGDRLRFLATLREVAAALPGRAE